MSTNKKTEKANAAENEVQTEDFRNIPAASDKKNPPDIKKKDIEISSKINKDGETDNTDKK
ncbi:hypothetical protein HER18_08505 [Chryseobacterium sp. NEB161]|nr:hypothetical protein HER18_08505 [Chryseobacterium sp. NEB161]